MLQRLGCKLPIEFWALNANDWTEEMERLAREELGVSDCRMPREEDRQRFTDAWAESAGRAGWELKPYSIIESRFREVLLLDADIVPVVDPTFLFDSPQLAEHGAIFWPDPTPIGPERAAWEIMGVPYRQEMTINSGQLLVDKARCWQALQLAALQPALGLLLSPSARRSRHVLLCLAQAGAALRDAAVPGGVAAAHFLRARLQRAAHLSAPAA